jgi:hypothetical protein
VTGGSRGDGDRARKARDGERSEEPPAGREKGQEDVYLCDLCGAVMLNLHCKLICERCGYRRDCSDP